jgi:hypothetical protein
VNLGNSRPNITPILARMWGAATDLEALNFSVDEAYTRSLLIRTIIFFNTRELAFRACQHLKSLLPPHHANQM